MQDESGKVNGDQADAVTAAPSTIEIQTADERPR
jgi:hypothetical protein